MIRTRNVTSGYRLPPPSPDVVIVDLAMKGSGRGVICHGTGDNSAADQDGPVNQPHHQSHCVLSAGGISAMTPW
jgi:hypothetical protein